MKVLDLDMDFFLTDACPLAPLGERPPEACAAPYSDEQVIRFLETQCGLSRAHPVPGMIFDTHDKALDFWLAQMEVGKLQPPFDVVHVDTHSDLAFGRGAEIYRLSLCVRSAGNGFCAQGGADPQTRRARGA